MCVCNTVQRHVNKVGTNLEILSEVCEGVSLGELQLHAGEASEGSSKAGEALLAAAAHPHQQGVASGLTHDTCYAGNVVHGILEEDEAHGLAAAAVVVFQELLQGVHQLGVVPNLHTLVWSWAWVPCLCACDASVNLRNAGVSVACVCPSALALFFAS